MGRQARLREERRNLRQRFTSVKASSKSSDHLTLVPLTLDEDEYEDDTFEVKLEGHPPRTLSFPAETMPCMPKTFIKEFDRAWIREAVLEYWEKHDFLWTRGRVPNAPALAGKIPLCDRNLPGDMASALSLRTFFDRCQIEPLPDEPEVRSFCIVVCGLGKAMQLVRQKWRGLERELLYEAALQVTGII